MITRRTLFTRAGQVVVGLATLPLLGRVSAYSYAIGTKEGWTFTQVPPTGNQLLTPDQIVRQALAVLHEKVEMVVTDGA